jgi:hypothetical protein
LPKGRGGGPNYIYHLPTLLGFKGSRVQGNQYCPDFESDYIPLAPRILASSNPVVFGGPNHIYHLPPPPLATPPKIGGELDLADSPKKLPSLIRRGGPELAEGPGWWSKSYGQRPGWWSNSPATNLQFTIFLYIIRTKNNGLRRSECPER